MGTGATSGETSYRNVAGEVLGTETAMKVASSTTARGHASNHSEDILVNGMFGAEGALPLPEARTASETGRPSQRQHPKNRRRPVSTRRARAASK